MSWVVLARVTVGLLTLGSVWGQQNRENENPPKRASDLSVQATRAFVRGDWQEASRFYHEILEGDPENPLILANLGSVEYQQGDFPACCHYLEKALALESDLPASREMLGMAYYRMGRSLRALAHLARAVDDQPESPRARNQMAVVLQSMEWYDGAEQSLRRAIQLDPEYRDAHYNLALVYADRDPPSLALSRQHYRKARELGVSADPVLEKRLVLAEGTKE